ncbi:conserved hypothetical protein [Tenacibaculum sediminilitoris]|uniref:hypothetical protein n=1 Tax=Tenacibaculum sediminilitoris TaxID=1820334 RepID=UPI00389561B1
MWNNEQKNIWHDIKDAWNDQPQSEKINIQVSQLLDEFKSKASQFEKDSINKDLAFITSSTTKFEKDSIKRDLAFITTSVTKFEKKSVKSGLNFISNFLEKVISKLKKNK